MKMIGPLSLVSVLWRVFSVPVPGLSRQFHVGWPMLLTQIWCGVRPPPLIWNMLDSLQRRSEEHATELQSRGHLVCRLLLEEKTTLPSLPVIQWMGASMWVPTCAPWEKLLCAQHGPRSSN